ncbi:MAG: LCP family protein [Gemmiger sp.]|nr:LCP family protein [Gemmiger sp.]
MSEPRKLNTGAAHTIGAANTEQRTVYHAGQQAAAPARPAGNPAPRTVRTPTQLADPAMEASRKAARQMAPPIPRSAPKAAPAPAPQAQEAPPRPAHDPAAVRAAQERYARQRSVSHEGFQSAQKQQSSAEIKAAMRARQLQAMQQRAAEATGQFDAIQPRTQVKRLDLSKAQGAGKLYDIDGDEEFAEKQRRAASAAPQNAGARQAAQAAQAAQPSQAAKAAQQLYAMVDGEDDEEIDYGSRGRKSRKKSGGAGGGPPRSGKHGRGGGGDDGGDGPYKGKGKGKKPKKKGAWWKILLGTLLAILLISVGTVAVILNAIAPSAGNITLSQLINTPKEYQGSELNVLICGVDWEEERADMYSDTANDGMTDLIMYVHFDFVNNTISMLQIPRNILVTDDSSVSGNYQINAVARTQGNDVGRLCELINAQFQLRIDGYITLNMASFKTIVDTFAPFEVYVPHEISYGGSTLKQGYQTMDGNAAEFFVRNRKGDGYANSDLDRLNMQRYFYSALFRRMKEMNAWDIARLTPVMLNYMETSLPVSSLVSVAVSMLKIPSSSMMVCQMPVVLGVSDYNGNSVVVAARQADADLMNSYFRPNTGPVDAAALGVRDDLVSVAGLTASDPNIQWMGDLNKQSVAAQQNENLDGSNTVTYVDPAESTDTTSSDAATSGEASSPAA